MKKLIIFNEASCIELSPRSDESAVTAATATLGKPLPKTRGRFIRLANIIEQSVTEGAERALKDTGTVHLSW